MEELLRLLGDVDRAYGVLNNAQELLYDFVGPVADVLDPNKYMSIDTVEVSEHTVSVYRKDSYGYDGYVDIPVAIFNSPDPVRAAKELLSARNAAKEQAEIARKMDQLRKLQKELGVQ